MSVTCLIASEVDAPERAKPVVWRLLSNRNVDTLEDAAQLIDWYRARWEIELLFLTLKEGCRVEALQLGSVQRIERALGIYLVPDKTPTLRQALHMIARPGGFMGRKGDGEPGVKSLWIGLERVAACVQGMRFQQRCG